MKGRVMMENRVKAIYTLSNAASIRIIDIEHGIDDRVLYLDMKGKTHKAKVYYTSMYTAYFMYGSMRIYLDECIKTDL